MVDDHPIYNCPSKISKQEVKQNPEIVLTKVTNPVDDAKKTKKDKKEKKSKSTDADNEEGENEDNDDDENAEDNKKQSSPDESLALFVSGLPFDANKAKFLEFIEETLNHDPTNPYKSELKTKDIILLNFPDNPSRCNGLGYINCSTKEDYDRCIDVLNGKYFGKLSLSVKPSNLPTKKASANLERINAKREKKKEKKAMKKSGILPEKSEGDGSAGVKKEKVKHCYRCGQLHDAAMCTNPRICYRCRGTDHLSSQCPHKKK